MRYVRPALRAGVIAPLRTSCRSLLSETPISAAASCVVRKSSIRKILPHSEIRWAGAHLVDDRPGMAGGCAGGSRPLVAPRPTSWHGCRVPHDGPTTSYVIVGARRRANRCRLCKVDGTQGRSGGLRGSARRGDSGLAAAPGRRAGVPRGAARRPHWRGPPPTHELPSGPPAARAGRAERRPERLPASPECIRRGIAAWDAAPPSGPAVLSGGHSVRGPADRAYCPRSGLPRLG